MEYAVIGDEETVLGFGMAGVTGFSVRDKQETEEVFKSVIQKERFGIIIITEEYADKIRSLVDQYIFSKEFPLIVEIPDRKGKKKDRPGIRELVNNAIGIKF